MKRCRFPTPNMPAIKFILFEFFESSPVSVAKDNVMFPEESSLGKSNIFKSRSMPDLAHELIRREIIMGILRPDEAVKQAQISSRLGISLAPIREALQRLESEGLVVAHRNRGYYVSPLDPNEIDDIFEMREWIEGRAAHLGTLNRTPEDVADLEKTIIALEDCANGSSPQFDRWAQLNREFHSTLLRLSGRHHLTRIALSLLDTVERYVWRDFDTDQSLTAAQEEHRTIFAAFKEKDAGLVQRLCEEHSRHTRDRVMKSLLKATNGQVD